MAPRWEFRVFGRDLSAEHMVLRNLAEASDVETRTDVYFAFPGRVDASLKLRGEKLDLKLLREARAGLELWEPAGEAEFPVARETLRGMLGAAGAPLEPPFGPVDREALIAIAAAAPGTRLVRVDKRRQRYTLWGASSEFTRISVDGDPMESIALEDADRVVAARAVAALFPDCRRNTSYQRFLVEANLRRSSSSRDAAIAAPGDGSASSLKARGSSALERGLARGAGRR